MRKVSGKSFLVCCGLVVLIVVGIAAVTKGFLIDSGNGRIPMGESQTINDSLTESRGTGDFGEYLEYTYQITENSSNPLMLCLESYWSSFVVLIDGEEIYANEDIYRELGVRRHWIELPQEVSGKVLTIRLYSAEGLAKQTIRSPIYLGEKFAVIYGFLCREGYALVFFCFTLIFGVIVLAWEVMLNRKMEEARFHGFLYLGMFMLDAGIWVLTDSKLLQLFTGKTEACILISFLSFLLLPSSIILFLREIVTQGKRTLDILCGLSLLIAGLIMFVYLFRIVPIYSLLSCAHILIIVTLFVTVRMIWIEAQKYHNAEAKRVLLGLESLSVFVFLALLSFWLNPSGRYALFYCVGILLFTGCLAYAYSGVVYRQMEKNVRNAVYRQMAYTDSMTGLGNRAAFERELKKQKTSEKLACIMFDSNNLKKINDTCGHQEGDQVIIETAECLNEVFDRIGSCFRIGGDEFVVIVKNVTEAEVQKKLAELRDSVCKRNRERRIPIDVACGYAMSYGRNVDAAELFEEADRNMYENKKQMKTGKSEGEEKFQ